MKPAGRRNPNCRFLCSFITENKNMCYTKIVTKKKGNKRYKIFKEDIEMAVVKLTTDNFDQEVLQAQQPVLVRGGSFRRTQRCKGMPHQYR